MTVQCRIANLICRRMPPRAAIPLARSNPLAAFPSHAKCKQMRLPSLPFQPFLHPDEHLLLPTHLPLTLSLVPGPALALIVPPLHAPLLLSPVLCCSCCALARRAQVLTPGRFDVE